MSVPARAASTSKQRRLAWAAKRIAAHGRLFTGLICGLAAYGLTPNFLHPKTRAILAWDFGVSVFLVLVAIMFVREPLSRIERDAARQEEGEWTIFSLTLAGIIFSFAAIVDVFSGLKDAKPEFRGAQVALVVATLTLSWLMTQATFALRYAHEYYEISNKTGQIEGGLEFPAEERPDYFDFLYFSLVLGMTFQVSDVQIASRKFRRLAAVHGLVSFLFNTIMVALTVNLAAGIL